MNWLKGEKLWKFVSPKEKRFLNSKNPSKQQLIDASWRTEALEALLWCLGLTEMTPLGKESETDFAQIFDFYGKSTAEFIEGAKVIDEDVIDEKLEEINSQHWLLRDTRLKNLPTPKNLDYGIVREKHYALNWATGYMGESWDNVTTDT